MNRPVGFLYQGNFFCRNCAPKHDVPVFPVNLNPYSQHCRQCRKLVVDQTRSHTGKPLVLFEDKD